MAQNVETEPTGMNSGGQPCEQGQKHVLFLWFMFSVYLLRLSVVQCDWSYH